MRLLKPGTTLGYKGSRLQQLSMDVIEGQSLQLHIGRLGEGGFAAQMGLGKGCTMRGEMKGVRRRCTFVKFNQFSKREKKWPRKRPPPHLRHCLARLHLEGLLGRILAGSAQSCRMLSLQELELGYHSHHQGYSSYRHTSTVEALLERDYSSHTIRVNL